jgi:tyrosinase
MYRPDRNDGSNGMANINAGQPIDQGQSGNPLNLSALRDQDYERRGVAQGFCSDLDGGLHGNVHVLIGNGTNMGGVPWAARDPIFWLHHSNIDRLWASWNKAGRLNPSGAWLTQSFTFADENGSRVNAIVRDFVDTEAIATGAYKYDKLEPVQPAPPVQVAASPPSVVATQAQPGTVRLSASAPVQVALASAPLPASARLRDIGQRRVFLVLQNLQASAPPNVLYNVYLDPPFGASGGPSTNPVATVNFFNAAAHPADHGTISGPEKLFSVDVTESIAGSNISGPAPSVRIAPTGTAAPNANPVIGSVSLVIQ